MLDSSLLQEFLYGFYGYGTYNAPFWFIGMEEGGGGSVMEIQQRLTAWDARGRRELEDVASYLSPRHWHYALLGRTSTTAVDLE